MCANAARIAQNERGRDLASLRVMGFTKGEAAFVLLGELAVITLAALPVGSLAGYGLTFAIARGFSSELYQIPAYYDPFSHGFSAAFILVAATISGLLVAGILPGLMLAGIFILYTLLRTGAPSTTHAFDQRRLHSLIRLLPSLHGFD